MVQMGQVRNGARLCSTAKASSPHSSTTPADRIAMVRHGTADRQQSGLPACVRHAARETPSGASNAIRMQHSTLSSEPDADACAHQPRIQIGGCADGAGRRGDVGLQEDLLHIHVQEVWSAAQRDIGAGLEGEADIVLEV